MDVQIKQLPPMPVVMYRHTGPYEQLGAKFEKLWQWVEAQGIPAQRTIGIYWDNPDFVPAERLRSAACVEVPLGWQLGDRGGMPLALEQLPAGDYATTTFVGPYEKLGPVWAEFTNHIENNLGKTITEKAPAFEVYVNDASDTPPEQLITELYMPVG